MNKLTLLSFVSCAGLLLASCGNTSETADSSAAGSSTSQASTTETLAADQTLQLAVLTEMSTANTLQVQEIGTTTAINQFMEGLFRLDENNLPIPALAADYVLSEDGLTYTFQLREDAKWSNGEPVTAHDFVYAWQKATDPNTAAPYAYMFEPIQNAKEITSGEKAPSELGIQATSDYELVVNLIVPVSYFPAMLSNPYYFPQNEAFVTEHAEQYGVTSEDTLYNGPFELANWDTTSQSWDYVKNPDYWDAENVQLDNIHVEVIKETATRMNLFESGSIDNTLLSGEYAIQLQGDPAYVTENIANTTFLQFNFADADLSNLNLRKALSSVLNREEIVTNILGNGSRATTAFVPDNFATDPTSGEDYTVDRPDFAGLDLEAATAYFEKAKDELGKDTFTFELVTDDDEASRKVGQYIQGAVETNLPGITLSLTNIPKNNRIAKGKSGEFQIILGGWNAIIPDPINIMDFAHSKTVFNYGGYNNAEVDRLLDAAENEDANAIAQRFEDIHAAEKIYMDELGVAPLYHSSEAFLWNPNVKGIVRHSVGARYDFKNAYIVE